MKRKLWFIGSALWLETLFAAYKDDVIDTDDITINKSNHIELCDEDGTLVDDHLTLLSPLEADIIDADTEVFVLVQPDIVSIDDIEDLHETHLRVSEIYTDPSEIPDVEWRALDKLVPNEHNNWLIPLPDDSPLVDTGIDDEKSYSRTYLGGSVIHLATVSPTRVDLTPGQWHLVEPTNGGIMIVNNGFEDAPIVHLQAGDMYLRIKVTDFFRHVVTGKNKVKLRTEVPGICFHTWWI